MDLEAIRRKISDATVMEIELVWLPRIMGNQTEEEINTFSSIDDNKIGLNGVDVTYCTSVYNKVKSGHRLTESQAVILRKMLPKYSKQFARMMRSE